jgi:hypothetical protein
MRRITVDAITVFIILSYSASPATGAGFVSISVRLITTVPNSGGSIRSPMVSKYSLVVKKAD